MKRQLAERRERTICQQERAHRERSPLSKKRSKGTESQSSEQEERCYRPNHLTARSQPAAARDSSVDDDASAHEGAFLDSGYFIRRVRSLDQFHHFDTEAWMDSFGTWYISSSSCSAFSFCKVLIRNASRGRSMHPA
uniref:Uncharacterized protein n=1 Tax=Ditylenchus dipsaci TaxID=166011 RepID=A0A915DVB6_9BILA